MRKNDNTKRGHPVGCPLLVLMQAGRLRTRFYLYSAMMPGRRSVEGEGAAQRPQKRMRGSAPAAQFSIIALGDTYWGAFSFYHRCKRYRFKIAMKKTKPPPNTERPRIKQCKRADYFNTTTFCVDMVPILTRYTPDAGTSKWVLRPPSTLRPTMS